jgi:hypothetical protein
MAAREPAACPVSTTSWRYGLRRTCRLVTGRSHRPRSTWPNQARLALLAVTHRYERINCLRLEPFQIAEYLRLAYGLAQAASECRCPSSGAALPNAEARNRSRTPAPARAAADSRSSRRLRPRSDGGTRWRAERQHSGRRRSARTGLASGQRPPPPVRRHPRHPESLRDLPVENPRLDQLGRR